MNFWWKFKIIKILSRKWWNRNPGESIDAFFAISLWPSDLYVTLFAENAIFGKEKLIWTVYDGITGNDSSFFFFQMKGIFLTTAFFLYTFISAVLNKSSKLIHLEAYSNYIKPLNCNWPKHKFANEIFMSQKLLFLDELSVFLI